MALQWCHNDNCGVSNHQPHDCLLNRLFRRISKKTSKLRVTGLCAGISPGPVNSPHKGPVTRWMFPFDDVIMVSRRKVWSRMTRFYWTLWSWRKFAKSIGHVILELFTVALSWCLKFESRHCNSLEAVDIIYWCPSFIRPNSQIPQCTSPIPLNTPCYNRNVHKCAHFCYKMVHYRIMMHCGICEMGLL